MDNFFEFHPQSFKIMGCVYCVGTRSGNGILINEAIWLSTVLIIYGGMISSIEGNKIKLFSVCFTLKHANALIF